MKLTFIGVGAAFALENFQSNMLVEADGQRLLIDAGGVAQDAPARIAAPLCACAAPGHFCAITCKKNSCFHSSERRSKN